MTIQPAPSQAQRDQTDSDAHVNLLLSTNAMFLQHAAVCLTSVLANTPDLFFDVVVVSQPEENLDEARFRRSVERFPNHSIRFEKFSIPKEAVPAINPLTHYTLETYTRLWIENFFPPVTERVLYLDVDLVAVGSIAPLWSIDLGGALLGAANIPGAAVKLKSFSIPADEGYFSAGVLIIDLQQWRTTSAQQEVFDYISANPDRVFNDVDQDLLNAVFHHRTKRIGYEWNAIRPFFDEPTQLPLSQHELDEVRRDAIIIHFNGNLKPWSYFCDHPRRDEYTKYLRMTEWRDFVPPDRTPLNMVRKRVSRILPPEVKNVLKAGLARLSGLRHCRHQCRQRRRRHRRRRRRRGGDLGAVAGARSGESRAGFTRRR